MNNFDSFSRENTDVAVFDNFDRLSELSHQLDADDGLLLPKERTNSETTDSNIEDDNLTLEDIRTGKYVKTNIGDLDLDNYDLFEKDKSKESLFDIMNAALRKTAGLSSTQGESLASVNPFKEENLVPNEFLSEESKSNIDSRMQLIQNMNETRASLEDEWKGTGRRKRLSSEEKDAMAEFFGDDWEDVAGSGNGKKKEEDPAKKYEAKFKARLKELDKLSSEVTEFTDIIVGNVKELSKSRAKGSVKLIADSSATVSSLLSTKLSIIDKKIGITKVVEELALKATKGSVGGKDDNFIIDQIMTKLSGRPSGGALDVDAAVNLLNNNDYQNQVETAIANITDLENSGHLQFSESERALQYSDLNPEIYVVADSREKTWEFVCLAEDGTEIPDYPLPPANLAKMEVDWEYGQYAKDKNSGITYQVILR